MKTANDVLLGKRINDNKGSLGFSRANVQSGRRNKKYSFSEGEAGLLTVAPTGSGKGRNCIMPNLLRDYKGTIIVTDFKGELAAVTARHRSKIGPTYIIDPFKIVKKKPDCLNPVEILDHVEGSCVEKANLLGDFLIGETKGMATTGKDGAFWEESGFALLTGVIAYILSALKGKDKTLRKLREILFADDVVYNLAVVLDTLKDELDPYAHEEISKFLQTADITRSGFLVTAQQHLRFLADPAMKASFSGENSFNVKDFIDGKPMTIYLVLPPDKLYAYGRALRVWVGSLLQALFTRKQLPEVPTLFILDEAAQLGTLDSLRTASTLMRGYGLRIWSFWQDLSQLKRLYPADWQTLINNSDVLQVFGLSTYLMAKELANVIGTVTPNELLSLPKSKMIAVKRGGLIETLDKIDYLKESMFKGKADPHPMHKASQKKTRG